MYLKFYYHKLIVQCDVLWNCNRFDDNQIHHFNHQLIDNSNFHYKVDESLYDHIGRMTSNVITNDNKTIALIQYLENIILNKIKK